MSKSIEAIYKNGQVVWPATATDAVIHPLTEKSLTDHITRYDLTEYDTVTSLETGIQKLIGDKSNGGLGIVPKEGDRILVGNWDERVSGTKLPGATEYIYFSDGELDEPGDNYYEYSRCWTEICYDTSDIPRLSSEGRLFSENSPIVILSDINVSEGAWDDPYLISANLGKYCHIISLAGSGGGNRDYIARVINSGSGGYVYNKIEKPDTKTIYYSISDDKFYRFVPRSGKTGGMEEIGPKEVTGVSINGVTVTPNLTGVINLGTIGNLQEITWSALKTLRDGENLTPGRFYRITDYTCTTTQTNTQSAGHVFDIIVFALSGSTLSEKAWADHHEGDTYFTNCKLEAWELKYCLDNDTTRFSWADTTNGKGVIYWMKDEWENECSYDFRNIQFRRQLTSGALDNANGTNTWCYTFNYWNSTTGTSEDLTIHNMDMEINNSGITDNKLSCYNNKIGWVNFQTGPWENVNIILPNNVFLVDSPSPGIIENNIFENNCYNNTLEQYSSNNIFEKNSCNNILGHHCYNNTLGKGCSNNVFGDYCICNTFGTHCSNIILAKNYIQWVTIDSCNRFITLTSTLTPDSSNYLQHLHIITGVNTTSTVKTISHNSLNDTFITTYKPANSVEISV